MQMWLNAKPTKCKNLKNAKFQNVNFENTNVTKCKHGKMQMQQKCKHE